MEKAKGGQPGQGRRKPIEPKPAAGSGGTATTHEPEVAPYYLPRENRWHPQNFQLSWDVRGLPQTSRYTISTSKRAAPKPLTEELWNTPVRWMEDQDLFMLDADYVSLLVPVLRSRRRHTREIRLPKGCTVLGLLRGIYDFYHYSPVGAADLDEFEDSLDAFMYVQGAREAIMRRERVRWIDLVGDCTMYVGVGDFEEVTHYWLSLAAPKARGG